jgi:predicted PurR-regulated permease PerM
LRQIKAGFPPRWHHHPELHPEPERAMTRLMLTLFSMIATTLMGVGVIIALTTGHDTLNPILIAAAIGFVLALPVTWFVARQLE